MERRRLISLDVDLLNKDECVSQIVAAARRRSSCFVCAANVHMLVESWRHATVQDAVSRARLILADGMPLTWLLRLLYGVRQERLDGMSLLPVLLGAAEQERIAVFLYGSTPKVLSGMITRAEKEYPNLMIAGAISPPFRPLSREEELSDIEKINSSGAGIVFVALGCPRQEKWMADRAGRVEGVMVGLGGAFPVYAGTQRRAPEWMQAAGLEWFFRFICEPRRLWRRYMVTNTMFLGLAALEVVRRMLPWQREEARKSPDSSVRSG